MVPCQPLLHVFDRIAFQITDHKPGRERSAQPYSAVAYCLRSKPDFLVAVEARQEATDRAVNDLRKGLTQKADAGVQKVCQLWRRRKDFRGWNSCKTMDQEVTYLLQVHQQQQQISQKEKEVRSLVKQAKKHTKQWTSTAETVAGTLKEYGDIQNYLEVLDTETAGLLADLQHLAELRRSRKVKEEQRQSASKQQPELQLEDLADQSQHTEQQQPQRSSAEVQQDIQEAISPSAASFTSIQAESEGSGEGLPVSSSAYYSGDG